MQAAFERQWNAIEQNVYREGWQDERQGLLAQIKRFQIQHDLADFGDDLADFGENLAKAQAEIWKLENQALRTQLAEKEAEIVRLTLLLDEQSKRRRS